jgi:FHS family L-fucose permease-like MFS transporter
MAIIGGATLTPLMGYLSEATHSIGIAYLVPLVCYLFVAFFAFVGSKIGAPAE